MRMWMVASLVALASPAVGQPGAEREVIVYTGPRNPAYAIPPHLKEPLRRENERRMWAAVRFQSEGEALLKKMQSDPHFGGLVFEHLPEPHAIVMFTGDATARLKRYTLDPRYHPRRVDLTLAQLERMKDDMAVQLHYLGLRCFSVDGDEEHNRVTVATAEIDKVRAAIADGRLRLPPKFALVPGGCDTLL
jgi:hypothetical protein